MRRLVLLLVLVPAVLVAPAAAQAKTAAKVPCRDRIYADWYADGKIASTYPIACYRDALKHAEGRADIAVYSGMIDDIKLALAAAIKRSQGQDVPSQVGGETPTSVTTTSSSTTTPSDPTGTTKTRTDTAPTAPDPGTGTTTTNQSPTSTVSSPSTGGGSGLPIPLLILGGAAILLIVAGGVGYGVRRYRGRPA